MKRLVYFLLLLLTMATPCAARDGQLWTQVGAEELERAGERYGAQTRLSESASLEDGLTRVAESVSRAVPQLVGEGVKSALRLLAVVLLCALIHSMHDVGSGTGLDAVTAAGSLAIAALAVQDMDAMLGLGQVTVENMHGFGQVLLPVMAACTALSGAPASAAARQVATAVCSNLLLGLIDRVLLPMVYAYVAVGTAYAVLGNPGLKRLMDIFKGVTTWTLTTVLVVFVSYLSAGGAVAGNTDAAALKAAKMTISTVIPVVGRILSDAAQTVLAGAGLLKNTVGVFGMVTVLSLCVVPFVRLGVHYLSYKVSAMLAGTVAQGRLAELISAVGTAFALVLGMTGTSAMLLLVSVVAGVSGVSGA